MQNENKIQAEIVKFYTNNYCLVHHDTRCLLFSIPNGGYRNKMEAMTLKSTGLLPGSSDLVIIHRKSPELPSILAFVEVKAPTGRQSVDQVSFERRVADLGFIYRVIRSLDEFKTFIDELEK